jgi:hypothetical protein
MIQLFFTPLTADRGTITAYAIDEFGFAVPLAILVIAMMIWRCPADGLTVARSRVVTNYGDVA